MSLRQVNSRMQGHPVQGLTPGIEASTGSLGQGLSVGVGHALAARLDGKSFRTYVLLGDGECQEGQVWEAAMTAGNYELGSLTAIVDSNRYQLDGAVEDINSLTPLDAKFESVRLARDPGGRTRRGRGARGADQAKESRTTCPCASSRTR